MSSFEGKSVSRSDVSDAYVLSTDFGSQAHSGLTFDRDAFVRTTFEDSHFSNVTVKESDFRWSVFTGGDIKGGEFLLTNLRGSSWSSVTLTSRVSANPLVASPVFYQDDLTDSKFFFVTVDGRPITKADLVDSIVCRTRINQYVYNDNCLRPQHYKIPVREDIRNRFHQWE